MERVTDDQFALLDGHVRHVPGGVDEYLRLLAEQGDEAAQRAAGEPRADGPSRPSETGLSNQERRELKKRFDAVSRRLEKTAGEPRRLREEMAAVDASDYAALMAAQEALDACLAGARRPRGRVARALGAPGGSSEGRAERGAGTVLGSFLRDVVIRRCLPHGLRR